MGTYQDSASFGTIRSAGFASIGAAYAAIGSALTDRAVVITFKNNTNGDVFVSTDGTNDHLFFPANSFGVYDVRTNAPTTNDLMFEKGTQFFVKDGPTAATSGTFYIETLIVKVNP